jgi:hypothetical protein
MAGRKRMSSDLRFAEKCASRAYGCIEWTAGGNQYGYGEFLDNGKRMGAHRWAYQRAHGPIPAGVFILHRCDNPACVNVDHLFAGTQRDNLQDASRKGRVNKTIKARGEAHPNRKTDNETVLDIRARFDRGERQIDIAKSLHMPLYWVHHIARRKGWKHI